MVDHSARRVLVVEDDALLRWAIVETLARFGHRVVETSDAATTLRALREATEAFDVVLLDSCLPDSNELTLLADIRRWSPTSAVVLMLPDHAQAAHDAHPRGVCVVLKKPFDIHVVHAAVIDAGGPAFSFGRQ
jgi:DNA-binding NtrC family response regulator